MDSLPSEPSRPGTPDTAAAETHDVTAMHAPILQREKPEPHEGYEPAPHWLVVLIVALVFWGGYYLGSYNGSYSALVFDEKPGSTLAVPGPPKPIDPLVLGKRVYANNCAACHQANGKGLPGVFPPLAGSDWVNTAGHDRIARIVLDGLNGPITVSGNLFNSVMVPWRDILTDDQIAAVLTYVRQEWGNTAPSVPVGEVTALRSATKDRAGKAWTADELLALPSK